MLKNIALVFSVICVLYAGLVTVLIQRKCSPGSPAMKRAGDLVRKGALAFLRKEYSFMSLIVLLLFLFIWLKVNRKTGYIYLLGVIVAAACGVVGIMILSIAAPRTANASRREDYLSLRRLSVASAGAIGFGVTGMALAAIILLYKGLAIMTVFDSISGFALGVSVLALFSRVGGRLYSRSLDLISSFACAAAGAMMFAPSAVDEAGVNAFFTDNMAAVFPLIFLGTGLIVSFLVTFTIRGTSPEETEKQMVRAIILTALVMSAAALFYSARWLKNFSYGMAGVCGIAAALSTAAIAAQPISLYDEHSKTPGKKLNFSRRTGRAMLSVCFPAFINILCVFAAYEFADRYGLALAACGIASLTGIILTAEAYSPIMDNAQLIAAVSMVDKNEGAPEEKPEKKRSEGIVAGDGYAISSAIVTSTLLFTMYTKAGQAQAIDLMNPVTLACLLLGGIVPFAYVSLTMSSTDTVSRVVKKGARKRLAEEVQQAVDPEVIDAKLVTKVEEKTESMLADEIVPGMLALILPILVGMAFGLEPAGAFIVGAMTTGSFLALMLSRSGGKLRRSSESVLNILIKLMAVLALVCAMTFGHGVIG